LNTKTIRWSVVSAPLSFSFSLAEVALRNAYAAARQGQSQGAIGWLQTAQQNGLENIADIIKESDFDPIRKDLPSKSTSSSFPNFLGGFALKSWF
jgi:hypothetical protein